jgi:hypothetical protein
MLIMKMSHRLVTCTDLLLCPNLYFILNILSYHLLYNLKDGCYLIETELGITIKTS